MLRRPHRLAPVAILAAMVVLCRSWATAASEPPLITAVRSGDAQAVQALLKARADVNARQGDRATALHWAAHLDDVKMADLLLRAGARPEAADDTGAAPLYLACTNRNA